VPSVISRLGGCVLVVSLVWSPSAAAQTPQDLDAIRRDLAALRAQQDAIQKNVDAIKNLLESAMGPRPAGDAPATGPGAQPLKIAGRPTLGSPRARVVIVEFSDYECPYCGKYAAETFPQVQREYLDSNKIRYVFKNFPLDQIHPNAFKAAVAAACAGDQSKYWPMHARLFGHQKNLGAADLSRHAAAIGLNAAAFTQCLDSPGHDALIKEDIGEGLHGGVRGTPVFVFGLAEAGADTIVPAKVLIGAQPFSAFKETIDALLAQAQ
jgi:protein-disulfide isomerase